MFLFIFWCCCFFFFFIFWCCCFFFFFIFWCCCFFFFFIFWCCCFFFFFIFRCCCFFFFFIFWCCCFFFFILWCCCFIFLILCLLNDFVSLSSLSSFLFCLLLCWYKWEVFYLRQLNHVIEMERLQLSVWILFSEKQLIKINMKLIIKVQSNGVTVCPSSFNYWLLKLIVGFNTIL